MEGNKKKLNKKIILKFIYFFKLNKLRKLN